MRNHKILYASSYDRGLQYLLTMWPEIKKKYKDATLSICYGWQTFDALTANNPERQTWKAWMVKMMKQEGVKELGRLNKEELNKVNDECGILAYPADFFEINCITVLNAQLHGCVPVTTSLGALVETNKYGVMVDGDIKDENTQKEYLQSLLDLMGDEGRRKKLSEQGKEWAKTYDWKNIAHKWSDEFDTADKTVKLSIYTPTIRRGWWNIMADNLSKQSYRNFEWIIVDDYPEDRSHIAKEYGKKYNLDIKYVRQTPSKVKRTYSLCHANNTAMNTATGDVLVFLQDFILIPLDGLEQVATMYRKHPRALQGLVDTYFSIKGEVNKESEDWFNGNTDVIGDFLRQNIRIQNAGLRKTDNPMDFEQNYGAIPLKIARELGGWWEFFDESLGWDNTLIAYRALLAGYEVLIDEANCAVCLDLWPTLQGSVENGGSDRARRLNDPRYLWMETMMAAKKLPLVRTQEIDDTIDLQYEIPKEVSDDDAVKWMKENINTIVLGWLKPYEKKEDHV